MKQASNFRRRAFAATIIFISITAVAPAFGDEVAALVGNRPITVAEVDRELKRTVGEQQFDTSALQVMRAALLEQLVRRALILEYLTERDVNASEADIDLGIARMEKKLAQEEKTLADFLTKTKLTTAELRDHFRWNISWDRYLKTTLTKTNLRKHFTDHHRSFDGSTLQVAHLLLKLKPERSAAEVETTLAEARRIRAMLASDELTFAAAAKQFSESPTAAKGGAIGRISRTEPMPESFSAAAFALEKGETSDPVVTKFGVHLIHCLSIEPGQRTFEESQKDVADSAKAFLFTWASDRQKKKTRVEFTGTIPYFRWGDKTFATDDE